MCPGHRSISNTSSTTQDSHHATSTNILSRSDCTNTNVSNLHDLRSRRALSLKPLFNHTCLATKVSTSLRTSLLQTPILSSTTISTKTTKSPANMPNLHQTDLVSSLSDLFTSSKYSDLTIRCGSDLYKVHRAVVCQRSQFFAAACDSGFKVHSGLFTNHRPC